MPKIQIQVYSIGCWMGHGSAEVAIVFGLPKSSRRASLSDVVNEALRQALHPVPPVHRDPVTGLGTIRVGRSVTAAEVADALADD